MGEPRTTLDDRFSEPGASPASWGDTRQALEESELFWLTTVRADGRPHVTPVVAVWLDDALYFTTGADEQKAHNLRANPHVVLTTGCNRWDRGLDLVVEGDAVRVADDPLLWRLASAWATKWDGRWQYEAHDGSLRPAGGAPGEKGNAMAFSVAPTKILSFGKGTFTQTRHRF
ncbi:MAG: pyridoxamine 5'-phosphate oxidase family protein [Acidimicrobiia bacterium]|nr:pyridoxamine 5'-phosphate oxidase family protein [Acidimicrobiia bacterium]